MKNGGFNALSTLTIIFAWIGLTILNLSDGVNARMIAIFFGGMAVLLIIVAVICNVRNAISSCSTSNGNTKPEEQESSQSPLNQPQTPILPITADIAERNVLLALRKKLTEYEEMERLGIWESRLYGNDEFLIGYESELNAVRKNLKDVGQDYEGNYNFCTCLTDVKKPYSTESARKRHFSEYFNDKCNAIIKKSLHVGLDESLEQVLVLSDYMLDDLGVRLDRKYIALKLREVEIRFHIARLKDEQKQKEQEERKAQRDYERALKDAARNEESARVQLEKQREALEKAATEQEKAKLQEKVSELESKLQEALTMKERAMSMAQQTRTGYVYVISNVRSFGEGVYKIGMTRRLDPMDRVRELGDASVPFPFDVHHMIYTDDAPKLEAQLHQRFAEQKMNNDNYRKEFFRVPLEEIESALRELEVIDKEKELG